MKIKLYIGNLDGDREALVVTNTKKRASEILRISMRGFNEFFHEVKDIPIDHLKPHAMYTRLYKSKNPWYEGRCPSV